MVNHNPSIESMPPVLPKTGGSGSKTFGHVYSRKSYKKRKLCIILAIIYVFIDQPRSIIVKILK